MYVACVGILSTCPIGARLTSIPLHPTLSPAGAAASSSPAAAPGSSARRRAAPRTAATAPPRSPSAELLRGLQAHVQRVSVKLYALFKEGTLYEFVQAYSSLNLLS